MGFNNISLGLGLGLCLRNDSSDHQINEQHSWKKKKKHPRDDIKEEASSVTLGGRGGGSPHDDYYYHYANNNPQVATISTNHQSDDVMTTSPIRVVSSLISNYYFVKRERADPTIREQDQLLIEPAAEAEVTVNENNYPLVKKKKKKKKKKLRLTKQQSALFEDTFNHHSTLHPKKKQKLSRKLNLQTRQIEVWFQNRRAKAKLKQTEVDYEVLKKCCEALTEENRMLQKELKELKQMKISSITSPPEPFYVQLPVASLTVCPSCKKICSVDQSNNGSSPSHHNFVYWPKSPSTILLYN